MNLRELPEAVRRATEAPDVPLPDAALVIARIEYPKLDPEPTLAELDRIGAEARDRVQQASRRGEDSGTLAAVTALNAYLFDDLKFVGNREQYEDPRNSCLNQVIERRTGIPITLAVVYMEVAKRAGLPIDGVNFPGHFLVRCSDDRNAEESFIIDPFHGGALLTESDCRMLLQRHVGPEAAFDRSLLTPATKPQIISRMLQNLKRLYVHMRSFPQARLVTDMLLAVSPSGIAELRDRGLLAYHMNDFSAALADLESYLKLRRLAGDPEDDEARKEHEQLWEHIKTLRRRVAALN